MSATRKPGRNFLFVPGPTNTPDRVLRAMHRAMEDHRSSDFPSLAAPVLENLKKIFQTTSGQAFIFPASGTGAWEASLTNTLSPGDKILAARFGMFSHLWIDMAQRLGLQVQVLDAEWGRGRADRSATRRRSPPTRATRSRPCSSPTTRPPPASPAMWRAFARR